MMMVLIGWHGMSCDIGTGLPEVASAMLFQSGVMQHSLVILPFFIYIFFFFFSVVVLMNE
jgi:hypothetical protein